MSTPNLIKWRCNISISIGDALLKLGVDTSDLDKGMQGIGNTIKKHQKAIGIGMVAAGGAILAAGVLSVKTFAEMGDEVAKMALKTGFSTEALSELRHAAELSGTSIQGIEKGVKRMASTLLDAEMGLATSVDALNELGLSVEDFKDLSPEEAFNKFMEAIASVEDPLKRSALAQDIFGKSGVDLLPIMASGSQGLAEMRQEAHDLGIVFDQEAADKAAKMNDAMTKLDASVSGVKMVIAEQLIPVLMPLIERLKEVITNVSSWMKEHPGLTKVIVIGTAAFGVLLVVLGSLLLLLPGITAAMGLFAGVTLAAIWPVTLIALGIAALIAIGILLWKNWDTISEKAKEIWEGIAVFFKRIWQNIVDVFTNNWDKILAILFPIVGLPILIARNWGLIVGAVEDIWDKVASVFAGVWETAKQWGMNLVFGLWEGIQSLTSWIWDKAAKWAEDLWDSITDVFDFGSPSKLAIEAGENIVLGLAKGIEDAIKGVSGLAMPSMPVQLSRGEIGGANSMGGGYRTANIYFQVDGRTLARVVGQPLVDEIRLRTGVRI